MGKAAKQKEAEAKQAAAEAESKVDRQAAIDARAPMRARIAARRKAIDAKDWEGAPDFIDNKGTAADVEKRMENTANLTSTGIAGLSARYASPDSVATQSKLLKDRQGQTAGAQYETDINNYVNQTNAMEQDSGNADQGLYSNFYQSATQQAWQEQQLATQIAMQRAQVVPQIIGMGLQGASMALGGFGVGNFGKK